MNTFKETYKTVIKTKNGTQKKRYYNDINKAIKFCNEFIEEGKKYVGKGFFEISISLQ